MACMTIPIMDYIPCSKCSYRQIGKTKKHLLVGNLEKVNVFEVTVIWFCLKCCHIQDLHVEIREIRNN